MSYAIRNDLQGWRAIDSEDDVLPNEYFSVTNIGTIILSKPSRIKALQYQYEIDRNKLNQAWLSAIIADGAQETARKAIISTQISDLQIKLQSDITAILAEE